MIGSYNPTGYKVAYLPWLDKFDHHSPHEKLSGAAIGIEELARGCNSATGETQGNPRLRYQDPGYSI